MSHHRRLALLVTIALSTTAITETSVSANGSIFGDETGAVAVLTEDIGTNEDTGTKSSELAVQSEAPAPAEGSLDLHSGEEIGPVSKVDVPTFETGWLPGEVIPSSITVDVPDTNVDFIVADAIDDSSFAVFLVVNSVESATEFRFNNAVPVNHSVVTQEDGSVNFLDKDDNIVSGISTPWAFDANGVEVPTSFTLDGTTLVQKIEHQGFDYPIIADPNWWKIIKGAAAASVGAVAIGMTFSACAGTVIGCLSMGVTPSTSFIVTYGVTNLIEGIREPSPPPRPRSTVTPGKGICLTRFRNAGPCRG